MDTKIRSAAIRAAHTALVAGDSDAQAADAGVEAARLTAHPMHYVAVALVKPDVLKTPAPRLEGAGALLAELRELVAGWRAKRQARTAVRLLPPESNLRWRAEARVCADVKATWKTCSYRRSETRWAGGDHAVTVKVGRSPHAAGSSTRVWSANGKWSGNNSEHHVGVKLSWRLDVQQRGVAVVDGLFTLDATPALGQCGVLTAVWVAQGRGFTLNTVHGFLVQTASGWKHARTAKGLRTERCKALRTEARA